MRKKSFVILLLAMLVTDASRGVAGDMGKARQSADRFEATLQVTDETGAPVSDVYVWLLSDEGKMYEGMTDGEGMLGCDLGVGMRADAYLDGRGGSLEIDEERDAYVIVIPADPGVPGVIVSVRPDDSAPGRLMVTVASDEPLIAEPEVVVHVPYHLETSSPPCAPPMSRMCR